MKREWMRYDDYAFTVRSGKECRFLWGDDLIAAKIIELIHRGGETYVILYDQHHKVEREVPVRMIYEMKS
jgi:hypothetical protein